MLKNEKILLIAVICLFMPFISFCSDSSDADRLTEFFPEMEGWMKDGKPEIFNADNLWEYINGAADLYLTYDFQEVATLVYEDGKKRSLTVDVYKHSSLRNAFGIYSQERPQDSDFLQIGAQGYYEKRILNFFKGCYYVKLMGFSIGDDEKPILTSFAEELALRLDGEARFPEVIACFPEKNKMENSERYIAEDFLGRGFLHSAFTAEYDVEGEKRQIFIIEAGNGSEREDMLNQYLRQVEEEGGRVAHENGSYRFEDPYFRSSGMMNLMSKGKYVWGLFSKDVLEAEFYLNRIEKKLTKNSMIE